jgi:hypothetical protein
MAMCVLCEGKNEFWFGALCSNCRRIKHFISIYKSRVYEVLDSVLSRTDDKQKIKEADEIKKEIENKEHNLRSSKKQVKRGEEMK